MVKKDCCRDPWQWVVNQRRRVSTASQVHPSCEGASAESRRLAAQTRNENGSPPSLHGHTELVALLKACAKQKDLPKGTRVHAHILKRGLIDEDSYVASTLVNMYAKCGALDKAAQVLHELPTRNVVTWNALISGYAQQGQGEEALKCFDRMQSEGLSPDTVTFTCILKACGSIRTAARGKEIHDEIVQRGLLGKDVVLGTTLVDMYAKCGALAKAARVLDELPVRNVVSWSALIAGYAQHGQGEEALKCFKQMQREGLCPNAVTYICVLKACGSIGAGDEGERVHQEILRHGLLAKDIVLGNALVDMYAKCGALAKAAHVLDKLSMRNVVSWSALIAGYAQRGQGEEALKCFERMQDEGLSPNAVIFASVFKACGSIGAAEKGEQIHDKIEQQGLLGKDVVLGTTLVDMYAKCGALAKAARLLAELPVRDVVSWNALIAGYTQQDQSEEALKCYEQMQQSGISPNAVTFICILKACGSLGAGDRGEQVHNEIVRRGLFGKEIVLGTTLVDMYAKCGALTKAAEVLGELPVPDVVTWTALIAGYAQHGQVKEALRCFDQMQLKGLSPNAVTLACVLSACSHAGLLSEAQTYFANMSTEYGVLPDVVHHSCMVDLFGRGGEFNKALAVVKKMPSSDHLPIWLALLGACRECGNVKLGRLAFDNVL